MRLGASVPGDNEKIDCPACGRSKTASRRRSDGAWKCHHVRCEASGYDGEPARIKPRAKNKPKGPIVETYDYADENGALLFQVTRHKPKDFLQRRPDGSGGWIWGLKDVRRVLYHLPELIPAVAAHWTIYVTEGEKDADAINEFVESDDEFMATCNPMGAGKWLPEYTETLRGANVIVVADQDEPGRRHALDVRAALKAVAASVRIVQAKTGHDVTDHLAAGHGLAEFVPMPEPGALVLVVEEEPGSGSSDVDIPESCWRKGFDLFRQACRGSTEAADAYIWGAYLTAAACVLGRQATLDCGFDVYPNVFVVSVGASGRARKTTAQAYFRGLLRRLDESVIHSSGIGSPEGLIEMLAGKGEGMSQRCVLDLNELSSLLLKASSEATRGLGPLLTTLYDCPETARLPNRKSNLVATEPYVSLISSTTRDWLQRDLTSANVAGGLGNRLIYLWGPEKPAIPFPPKRDSRLLAEAEEALRGAMNRHRTRVEYGLTPEALEFWSPWYIEERARKYENPIAEALAQRLHVTALKVAMIYAAIEGTLQITTEQIAAAVDFANYQRDVQRIAFEGYGHSNRQKIEARIKVVLRDGGLPAWRIVQLCRAFSAADVQGAIKALTDVEELTAVKIEGKRKPVFHLGHE